ncbi:MAG: FtsQ-type POTRA domain-containing protein, partial [Acidimicrobiales bacterium]
MSRASRTARERAADLATTRPRGVQRSESREPREERVRRPRRPLVRLTRFVVVTVLVLATLAVAGEWVLRQSYFRVQHISFVGVRHEPLALVLAASGLEAHPTMLDVNATTIKANLAQFAWIDSVRLTKH